MALRLAPAEDLVAFAEDDLAPAKGKVGPVEMGRRLSGQSDVVMVWPQSRGGVPQVSAVGFVATFYRRHTFQQRDTLDRGERVR